ncbi:hypothetical protein AB6884_06180 [Carnobacterium maltaromaticum]|uniref:hypothetical protein n=1 Tax=Carnobacterium maltaromaticum TaxID=2751 RepID=UPI0039BE2EF5
MEISKNQLKKVSRSFRLLGSRVINAHYIEANSIIKMFVDYIDDTPVIKEYIDSVYVENPNINDEIYQVLGSYGELYLSTGNSPEEEVNCIYQILKFISENTDVHTPSLGMAYTSSTKYQDTFKEFGNRVVMTFVNEVNRYLYDISTDMGYDEESKYMITVNGGQAQVNISNDNSTINANQNVQINKSDFNETISELKQSLEKELSDQKDIKNILMDQIELIESEMSEAEPKKSVLKSGIDTVNNLLKTVPLAVGAAEGASKLYTLIAPLFM